MSLTRQIARNTLVQIIGKGLGLVFGIATLGILTRYLGPTGFGYYTTVFAMVQIFATLVDFGIQMTTVQLISDPREDEVVVFRNIFTIRITTSIICLGLGSIIAQFLPYPNEIRLGIAITALTFFCSTLISTLCGVFQKKLQMKKVAIADFLNKFLLFVFVLLAIQAKLGLMGIFFMAALSNLLSLAVLLVFTQRLLPLGLAFDWGRWKKIFLQTWPIALTIVLNLVYFRADTIILSLMRSQTEVGFYGAPYKILEVMINFAYLFLGLLLPFLTKAYVENNLERFRLVMQKGYDAMVLFSLPLVVGGLVVGQPVMTLIAGREYGVSGDILKILMLATMAIFLSAVFGYGVVAINRQKDLILFYIINAVLSVAAYLILIPTYSVWAAAWITVLSECTILVAAAWVVRKHTSFMPRQTLASKGLIASLVMGACLLPVAGWNILLVISLGIAVYGLALYVLKAVTPDLLSDIFSPR